MGQRLIENDQSSIESRAPATRYLLTIKGSPSALPLEPFLHSYLAGVTSNA